jgi:4-nitrophenyl phosphatase
VLADCRGFVFDLDGCVWQRDTLNPGAAETLTALHRAGRGVAFLTNNSRMRSRDVRDKLQRLGLPWVEHTLTPLEILGRVISERFGRSRVLVIGAQELIDVVAEAGHEIVGVPDFRKATVVAVGNDFDLSYERLGAASRAAAAGAALVTPNVDTRFPIENGDFLPGCGAIVAAVVAAAGVSPIVVGKPEPPLFRIALDRLGLAARDVAMVGDSVESDMAGGRRAGMRTVLYAPEGEPPPGAADAVVSSFAQLARLAGVR